MEKLSREEVTKIKNSFLHYNFNKDNSVTGKVLVKFNDNVKVTTYSDIKYGGRKEDFELQAKILKKIVMELITIYNKNGIVLIKYRSDWITNKHRSLNLVNWFHNNKIRTNFSGALKLNEKEVIEDFITANFEYNSFTHFLIPESQIIISPTDHMDVFIVSKDIEKMFLEINKITERIDNKKQIMVCKVI